MDTIKRVEFIFDQAKSEANVRTRGLPFSLVKDKFEWDSALIVEDSRREYGERRYRAFGYVDYRLHVVVYAVRTGAIRVISLRKASRREVRRYATQAESGTD